MKAAVQAVQKDGMPVRAAGRTFGVPHTTLSAYLKKTEGEMEPGFTSKSKLSYEEEAALVEKLKTSGVLKELKLKKDLSVIIHDHLCMIRGDPNYPALNKGWITNFLKRNPNLLPTVSASSGCEEQRSPPVVKTNVSSDQVISKDREELPLSDDRGS